MYSRITHHVSKWCWRFIYFMSVFLLIYDPIVSKSVNAHGSCLSYQLVRTACCVERYCAGGRGHLKYIRFICFIWRNGPRANKWCIGPTCIILFLVRQMTNDELNLLRIEGSVVLKSYIIFLSTSIKCGRLMLRWWIGWFSGNRLYNLIVFGLSIRVFVIFFVLQLPQFHLLETKNHIMIWNTLFLILCRKKRVFVIHCKLCHRIFQFSHKKVEKNTHIVGIFFQITENATYEAPVICMEKVYESLRNMYLLFFFLPK